MEKRWRTFIVRQRFLFLAVLFSQQFVELFYFFFRQAALARPLLTFLLPSLATDDLASSKLHTGNSEPEVYIAEPSVGDKASSGTWRWQSILYAQYVILLKKFHWCHFFLSLSLTFSFQEYANA